MKRSEMITKVLTDIKDILNNSPKVVNDIENKETMELILDLFESYGMKPPAVQFHTDNGVLDSEEFMWESEDDNEEK